MYKGLDFAILQSPCPGLSHSRPSRLVGTGRETISKVGMDRLECVHPAICFNLGLSVPMKPAPTEQKVTRPMQEGRMR